MSPIRALQLLANPQATTAQFTAALNALQQLNPATLSQAELTSLLAALEGTLPQLQTQHQQLAQQLGQLRHTAQRLQAYQAS